MSQTSDVASACRFSPALPNTVDMPKAGGNCGM